MFVKNVLFSVKKHTAQTGKVYGCLYSSIHARLQCRRGFTAYPSIMRNRSRLAPHPDQGEHGLKDDKPSFLPCTDHLHPSSISVKHGRGQLYRRSSRQHEPTARVARRHILRVFYYYSVFLSCMFRTLNVYTRSVLARARITVQVKDQKIKLHTAIYSDLHH